MTFSFTSNMSGTQPGWKARITVLESDIGDQVFWFKADDGLIGDIDSWADISGNGHTANNVGMVSLNQGDINFNPSLSLTNVEKEFRIFGTATVQSLVVVSETPYNASDLSGLAGAEDQCGIRLANQNIDPLGADIRPYYSWRGDNDSYDWISTMNGGRGRINGIEDIDLLHESKWHIANLKRHQPLQGIYFIGGYSVGRSYSGKISEVLGYSADIANQESLESYLAVKYGITLGNKNVPVNYVDNSGRVVWSANTTYQNNVAGIGREDYPFGLHQRVSSSVNTSLTTGSDVVVATTNDFTSGNDEQREALTDGQYLIWGDNAGDTESWINVGGYSRVARTWQLQNSGDIGEVWFQINLNGYPAPEGEYLLIVDDDNHLLNGINAAYDLTNTGGDLFITSFDPPPGLNYFTIGYRLPPIALEVTSLKHVSCYGAKDGVVTVDLPEASGSYIYSRLSGGIRTIAITSGTLSYYKEVFIYEPPDFTFEVTSDKQKVCEGESVKLTVDFPVDFSMRFNGDGGYVKIPDSPQINTSPVSSRTLMLWFKAEDVVPRQVLFAEGNEANGFSIFVEDGGVYAYGWNNNVAWKIGGSNLISEGMWHHIAYTWDSEGVDDERFKVYLDGNMVGHAHGGSMPSHGGDIRIGNAAVLRLPDNSTGSGYSFKGKIDEFRLWNTVLTLNQIQAEMSSMDHIAGSPVVSYNFNDKDIAVVTDLTQGNNGEIVGTAVYESDYSLLWDDPTSANTFDVYVAPIVTRTYNVSLTDENGCTKTKSITIQVNKKPEPRGIFHD